MRCNLLLQTLAVGLLAAALYVTPALAQWSTNPKVNNAVSTAANDQYNPTIVSDDSGGAIITWQDDRDGTWDIYAQRVNASGAPLWGNNGVAVCTAPVDQINPTIVSDGTGGAIITWQDRRGGSNYDIYAQRVNAAGVVQWTTNGIAICAATGDQVNPAIVPDSSGGAIITWADYRSGNYDIYAQRANASGAVQWTADGVAICTAAGNQEYPTIVSDGSGGAVITWQDYRTGSNWDVYAQRVDTSGAAQWTANGVAICTATGNQEYPTIVADGWGGAIITWYDLRGGSYYDIYAQRVNASGAVQWTANGVAICTAANSQCNPVIVSDGSGGAIITWYDLRGGSYYDIYAQRVNVSGTAQWTANGVAICAAAGNQEYPTIVSDGFGGAVITWYDQRSGDWDIYAQRVNAAGAVQWMTDGVAICTAMGDQDYPIIVSDGSGGAIITWKDYRNGSDYDLYAQKIDRFGNLGDAGPHIAEVKDVINDQGGKVTVSWSPSYLDVYPNTIIKSYYLFRGVNQAMGMETMKGPGDFLKEIASGRNPKNVLLKMPCSVQGMDAYYWEYIDSVRALRLPGYSYTMPTVSDSGPQGNAMSYALVMARTADELMYWFSNPDSGYSIDNLAPITPQNAAIVPLANGPILAHWNKDRSDPDVGYYSIYRSTTSGFPVNNSTRLRITLDTTVTDSSTSGGLQYYYRMTTVDIHGNESLPTAELGIRALPLQLASLTATTLATGVQLDWTTVSETNSLGFYVERRAQNTGTFATVSNLIPGAGTSLQQHHYQWMDTKVTDGNYDYRLKLVDLNGSTTYSSAIMVTVSGVLGVGDTKSLPKEFALRQNYPNPFNPSTVINYELPKAVYVRLVVYDMLGRQVATVVDGAQEAGYKSVEFSAANLPSGIYTYRLTAGTYVEVKKMLLLK